MATKKEKLVEKIKDVIVINTGEGKVMYFKSDLNIFSISSRLGSKSKVDEIQRYYCLIEVLKESGGVEELWFETKNLATAEEIATQLAKILFLGE